MNFITGARLRRLLPASAVIAAIAIAYMSPLPVDASKVNNCGVKGGYAYGGYAFAFHDHGKPCPNRPFPGKGKGIMKFLINLPTSNTGTSSTTSPTTHGNPPPDESEGTRSSTANITQSTGKSHDSGKVHGHAYGHQTNRLADSVES